MLADLNRVHNWDQTRQNAYGVLEEYDNLNRDKPTCYMGIKKRALQFLSEYLMINLPCVRPLSNSVIRDWVRAHSISEGEGDTLFNRIQQYSIKETRALLKTLHSLVISGDMNALSPKEKTVLDKFNTGAQRSAALIETAKQHFGKDRQGAERILQNDNKCTENYAAVIERLCHNAPLEYLAEIMRYSQRHLSQLIKTQRQQAASALMIPSPAGHSAPYVLRSHLKRKTPAATVFQDEASNNEHSRGRRHRKTYG